jgi:hypothetical protein
MRLKTDCGVRACAPAILAVTAGQLRALSGRSAFERLAVAANSPVMQQGCPATI